MSYFHSLNNSGPGGSGGSGFPDPTVLAGLDWHMDPFTISGSDGAAVSSWLDSSSAAKHYGQSTSTNQPIIKRAIVNGHDVVRFSADDKLLANPNPRTLGTANTIIIICTPTSGSGAYLLGGSGGEGGPAIISGFSSKAFEYFVAGSGERATFATSASGFHILALARTDGTGNYVGYFDGTQVFSNAIIGASNWNGKQWDEIAANGTAVGNDFYSGDIAGILHWNQNHAGTGGLATYITDLKTYFNIT